MSLPAPILARLERSGGENALNAQLLLVRLHILNELFKGIKALDIVDGFEIGRSVAQGKICVGYFLIIDNSVALDDIGDAVNAVARSNCKRFILEVLIKLRALEVGAVFLPRTVADGAVYLEECRCLLGSHSGGEGGFIGARRRSLHYQLNAAAFFISGRDPVIDLGDLGLEVEIAYLLDLRRRAAGVGVIAAVAGGKKPADEQRRQQSGNKFLYHIFTSDS